MLSHFVEAPIGTLDTSFRHCLLLFRDVRFRPGGGPNIISRMNSGSQFVLPPSPRLHSAILLRSYGNSLFFCTLPCVPEHLLSAPASVYRFSTCHILVLHISHGFDAAANAQFPADAEHSSFLVQTKCCHHLKSQMCICFPLSPAHNPLSGASNNPTHFALPFKNSGTLKRRCRYHCWQQKSTAFHIAILL